MVGFPQQIWHCHVLYKVHKCHISDKNLPLLIIFLLGSIFNTYSSVQIPQQREISLLQIQAWIITIAHEYSTLCLIIMRIKSNLRKKKALFIKVWGSFWCEACCSGDRKTLFTWTNGKYICTWHTWHSVILSTLPKRQRPAELFSTFHW